MSYGRFIVFLFGATLLGCNNTISGGDPNGGDLAGLTAVRIDPADLTLDSSPTQPATYAYKAFGTFPDGEKEITNLVMFYPDNTAVGGFTQALFQASAGQGGDTHINVQANGVSATAHLLVRLNATVKVDPAAGMGTPLPADPSTSFHGTPSAARAPTLVYPNNGVILPPNIQALEVHWQPGSAQNTLFQLAFQSNTLNVTTYTRCGQMVNGGCVFALDPNTYSYVANSSAGGQPVNLTVSGSDDAGTGFGQSAKFQVQFSQENVNGGLYYWTVSGNTGIMRVDFGATTIKPTLFLSPSQNNFPTCVGCHAISRDGTKMVSSLGGQGDGRLVYIANMAAAPAQLLTLNGTATQSSTNHIQFASFNPDGSRFVSVYADTNQAPEMNTLFMHDGTSGLRLPSESVVLTYEPDHPDWSPSGSTIAFSHVGIHQTSQRPFNCGLDVIQRSGSGWGTPSTVVPIVSGKSRYNPNFAPDSSFFTFSESTCPNGNNTDADCDGDSDSSATTWAVLPRAGATPVHLARAGSPGVMDGTQTKLSDTYPRFSPFQQKQGSGRLFWVTISSTRKGGLRDPGSNRWLWMFAVDPDKVAAGQDGSYPAFFLPFQDLATSNHIGQWTQKVVTGPG
jgi:hypothetical protein